MGCIISMPSGLVGASLSRFGTPEQQERWLVPLARGEIFGAAGVTEPRSGSDVAGMTTSYVKDGDGFVINGAKAWITNIDIADFFVTFATRDRSLRQRGITAFMIPRDTPGVSVSPYKDKLGFRPLCSGDLVFDDVRVGPEALLGEEDGGFTVAMTAVERGRLGVAARGLGLAQACLERVVELRQDPRGVRHRDRELPDRPGQDHGHGGRRRDRQSAHSGRCAGAPARRAGPQADEHGEDVRDRRRIPVAPPTPSRSTAPPASLLSTPSVACSATPRCCRSSRAATTFTAR